MPEQTFSNCMFGSDATGKCTHAANAGVRKKDCNCEKCEYFDIFDYE